MPNANLLRKMAFGDKLRGFLTEYKNVLVCAIDFVGSNQMQQIRIALRGKAVVLIGKNTVIRRVMDEMKDPKIDALCKLVQGNIGLVFSNGSNAEIRKIIEDNKRPAPAKVGVYATNDVVVPAGPTGLDPGQTAFFQSMEIATKIMRGSIEILNDTNLLKSGDRVTASHVAFLAKLNIKPFSYGMKVLTVYEDGFVFDARVLDMSQSDILASWFSGVRAVAALSLMTGMPTTASVPFSVKEAFRKLLAFTFVTKHTFKEAKDLDKLLAAGGGAAATAAPAQKAAAKKAPEPEPEDESESEADLDMGGLFGGGDDDEEEEDEDWDEEDDEEEEE